NDILVWNIALKPGNTGAIDQVAQYAKDNPDRQIVAWVEMGAAGGHHSWESMDLLRTNYRKLRSQNNIIVLVGGGVRNQEDAARFLSGEWGDDGVLRPMDGVFLGTRMMTVAQAHTSPQVKELLV